MAKAKIVTDGEGKFYGIRINCPGCRWGHSGDPMAHVLPVGWTPPGMERSASIRPDPWTFNGDLDKPVFGPSLLLRSEQGPGFSPYVCHSFIGCNGAEPGQIIFLGDSTHSLSGQVVELPDLTEES